MLHADTPLAARMEALAAQDMRRFVAAARAVDPASEAELLEIAGGAAAFIGRDSLINRAFGLGFAGHITSDDVGALLAFYFERGERACVAVCPLADGSLAEELGDAGFVVESFEHVLVRELPAGSDGFSDSLDPDRGAPAGLSIREATSEEDRALWAHVAATGFSAPFDPLPQQLELGRVVTRREGSRLMLACIDGRPAGTGELLISDEVAWLSADAVLPQYRGRGVHAALQRHRLGIAVEAACTLAVTEARPGSPSQRNMERLGFTVAYTRVDLLGPSVDGLSRGGIVIGLESKGS